MAKISVYLEDQKTISLGEDEEITNSVILSVESHEVPAEKAGEVFSKLTTLLQENKVD